MKTELLKEIRSNYRYKFRLGKIWLIDLKTGEIRHFPNIYAVLLRILNELSENARFPGFMQNYYRQFYNDLQFREAQRNFNRL